mmetsp:Transcript_27750/g.60679  ORF Transcript_27750/g.60679 Transcript_27750/m.60679 type:complete len:256 (+) Transcript_27750:17-784(+)
MDGIDGNVPEPDPAPPAEQVAGSPQQGSKTVGNAAKASLPEDELAKLEQLLRNYRLRRRLGLLPGEQAEPKLQLRWVRQAWRMPCPKALSGPEEGQGRGRSADLMADVAELQRQTESAFGALNAERRAHGALTEGLRRQGESAAAIAAEGRRLREQLGEMRREAQERATENARLSERLSRRRESHAKSLTQAALLAHAVVHLSPSDATSDEAKPGNTEAESELAQYRLQIAALVQERALLERRAAGAGGVVGVAS